MWLMTKHGFYSIVQKEDGYHIRAREREDLERLLLGIGENATRERIPLHKWGELLPVGYEVCPVVWSIPLFETPDHDYRYRIIVDHATLQRVMDWLSNTCDYPNFKAQIDSDPAQKRKPYHEIWGILARALGAYGRKGQ